MEESSIEASTQLLESSRFWIQRILVPIVVFIGVAGNAVSVVVLTRKKMLCTTTIYLTALAIADVIYLIFVLILSFGHYPNIHDEKYQFYWSFFAISHWICDAASNTSVWLTVSFTVERYIVVCYPIRGKVLCTEGRAKCIIAIVYIMSLMAAFSTLFEYELYSKCLANCEPPPRNSWDYINETYVEELIRTDKKLADLSPDDERKIVDVYKFHEMNNSKHFNATVEYMNKLYHLVRTIFRKVEEPFDNSSVDLCCKWEIGVNNSALVLNETYQKCFFWFTSLTFGVIPLLLIANINSILIYTMFKSRSRRKRMTIRRRENQKMNHENRITLLLIVVVILFLICQTPTAAFLMYDTFDPPQDKVNENYKKTCGNVFNFMLTLNAALNFVLYCVFSNKYRKTFKELFCQKKADVTDTFGISKLSNKSGEGGGGTGGEGDKLNFRRNQSEYIRTPRNLETNSLPVRSKSLLARTSGNREVFRI